MSQCKRFPRGFTVVELLTVVAIISVLVTMLIPYLRQARELVYRARCQANMRVIGGACYAYIGVWNCFPPSGLTDLTPDGSSYIPNPHTWWYEKRMLGQYMGCDIPHNPGLPPRGTPVKCPSRAFSLVYPGVPPNPENSWIGCSWSIVPYPGYTPPKHPMHRVYYRGAKLEEFRNPAAKVPIYLDARGGSTVMYISELQRLLNPTVYSAADNRHSGGTNYLFADNHVQYIANPDMVYAEGGFLQP